MSSDIICTACNKTINFELRDNYCMQICDLGKVSVLLPN